MSNKTAHQLIARIISSRECPEISRYMKNPEQTCCKIQRMIEGGISSLQVISDFDHTMSQFMNNGKVVPSTFGVLSEDLELTGSSRLKLKQLHEKYHPFELDVTMSVADRTPLMQRWYQEAQSAIVESNLHYDVLKKVVRDSHVTLRKGVHDLVYLLNTHKIPLLIFSAGIGDVIRLLLRRFSLELPNVSLISNFMNFNDQNTLTGFSRPIIFSFCKTAATIANTNGYRDVLSSRPCVLLIGDNLGDVHMADGATNGADIPDVGQGTVLRIGFLNENVEENLDAYKAAYDIVLVNDDSFAIPLAILQCVIDPVLIE